MIKAEFKGTPIVPKDASFPEIGELRGQFGKEVLAEYKGRAEKDYGNAKALQGLSYSDGVIKGSNPFAVVLINQIVRGNNLRTATPADLEKALNVGIDLRGVYTDSALVLRSKREPNAYLAKNLADQINLRQEVDCPIMIPLNGLELVKDLMSDYGLSFKLRDEAKLIKAKILGSETGSFNSENVDLETGLPTKLGNGNRTLYTINSGLSRVYLNDDLGLDSYSGDLAGSDGGGRVRLTSTEGAKSAKILESYIQNLNKAKAEEIAKIEKRYGKALDFLMNK